MAVSVLAREPVRVAGPGTAAGRPVWLPEAEFPFQLRSVELDGQRIHYVDEGRGPTLLFVHAGPAWSFIFRDVIVRLREHFRCVALDFPGSGLSPALAGYRPGFRPDARVLEAFVRALDLRDVTLVVHDLGGPVAFGVAARLPERFRALAVAESFGWPLAQAHPDVARMLRLTTGPAFRLVNDVANVLARVTATSYGIGRRLSPAGRAAFRGPYRDRRVRRNALAFLGEALTSDDYLREVERGLGTVLRARPVLLVFGGRSAQLTGFPERWLTLFPAARKVVVEGAHHFPMADDPDAVAGAIRSWWGDVVAPPPAGSAQPTRDRPAQPTQHRPA